MRVFQFRITGLNETDLKRWRNHGRGSPDTHLGRVGRRARFVRGLSGVPRLVLYTLLVVGSVYAVQWVSTSTTPSVKLSGTDFRGRNVVALIDNSGSMTDNDERQSKLHELLGSMLSADMAVQTVSLYSYGFQATSADPNALSDLELALLNHPEADSLFVFSDFEDYRNIDFAPAYERIRKLLKEHGARLYLGSVDQPPPPGLISVAKDSGGDVINAR